MSSKAIRDAIQSATHLHQAGDLDRAEQLYNQILRVQPKNADALHLLGVIACQRNQFDRAVQLIGQAISVSPRESGYYNSLGNAHQGLKQLSDAITAFQKACELDPRNLAAINNLGIALDHADQTESALNCFDRLLAIKSDIAQWHSNRGTVQINAGQVEAAIASQRKAIALQPDLAGAHAKLATALLSAGEFTEGWREFAWRFRAGAIPDPTRDDPAPLWDGSPIAGKTLLIQAEQGLGDVLQCLRYVPMIAEQDVKVILRCPAALCTLLQRTSGVHLVIATEDPVAAHDLQIPIFSLPSIFRSDEQTIPRRSPYISYDPQKAARYPLTGSRKRIGLAWAGSRDHHNNRRRSCPAELFNALAGIDAEFYRLQLPADLASPSALPLIDDTGRLKDFDDTAALVSRLDLVISVDTSVAHLAGAMGKPVWILLPFAAEWRWMTDRSDSPWYPSARLFRQSSAGNWPELLNRVQTALRVEISSVRDTSAG